MKLVILVFGLISCAVASASPDSFYVTQDGRQYLCRATDGGTPGGDPTDCIAKAYQGPFSRTESIELCDGANDTGPADCAMKLYAGPFSKDESLQECKGGTLRRANCVLKAYAGPYSKQESLQICRNTNIPLLMRSLDLINSTQETKAKAHAYKLKFNLK